MCDKNKLKIITNDTVEAILSVSKNVEKIILFGLQARGDSNVGSDIDILVVVTRREYESKVDTLFYQNIKRDGIVLFSI